MPTVHYKYGGSTAGRTMQCPAWIKLTEKMPQKSTSTQDADRGTLLHDCMEELLRNPDIPVENMLGRRLNDQIVTEEELDDAIRPALNSYLDFADERDFLVELPEVEVVHDLPDTGGTSDIIACNNDTVFIIDWKFGFHKVDAKDNSQGLFYAMCARLDPRTKKLFEGKHKLCIVIIQPTTEDVIDYWDTTIDMLDSFEVSYQVARDNQDENRPMTGEYCKFCPAMPICPAKTGMARQAMMLDPNTDEPAKLSKALDLADDVIEWAQSVKKFAHEQAELGLAIEGYKLVDKRATRKWVNEVDIIDTFKRARSIKLDEVITTKVMSPAQFEKFCKKKGVDYDKYSTYIEKVSSGTTLTTSDDPRPVAFNASAFAHAINTTD